MDHVHGCVSELIWQDKVTGFTIIKVDSLNPTMNAPEGVGTVVCSGNFPFVKPGLMIYGDGEPRLNKYKQLEFKLDKASFRLPSSEHAVVRYFQNGGFPNISGSTLINSLTREFKGDVLRVIYESPDRLATIKGIPASYASEMNARLSKEVKTIQLRNFLTKNGFNLLSANKLIDATGLDAARIMSTEPYSLVKRADLPFRVVDEIALAGGYSYDSPDRIKTAIMEQLALVSNDGSTAVDRNALISNVGEKLKLTDAKVDAVMGSLTTERTIYKQVFGGLAHITEAKWASIEFGIAVELKRLMDGSPLLQKDDWKASDIKNPLMHPDENGVDDGRDQRNSVLTALKNNVTIVTGGPGVGKTTTVKTIMDLIQQQGTKETGKPLSFAMSAPSGLAARRLASSSDMKAATLHRTLGIQPGDSAHLHDKIIQKDVFVIDEASMLDLEIFYAALKAIPTGAKLIVVGDPDQLPSVGAGNVLADLIDSKLIPIGALKTVFRNAGPIAENANLINDGNMAAVREGLQLNPDGDWHFIQTTNDDETINVIKTLTTKILPNRHNIRSDSIQMLAPMKKHSLGTSALNEEMQKTLNPSRNPHEEVLKTSSVKYKAGDRIINLQNNDKLDIVNGDIGQVVAVNADKFSMDVLFDTGIKTLKSRDLRSVLHAWTVTVHKSQGSEYPAIIVPLSMKHKNMWTRQLLYTAVTRAKQQVYLVGDPRVIEAAVNNTNKVERVTSLKAALNHVFVKMPSLEAAKEKALSPNEVVRQGDRQMGG